jgi:hypothetical protein
MKVVFLHSIDSYPISLYVPGTVLGVRDIAGGQADSFCLQRLTSDGQILNTFTTPETCTLTYLSLPTSEMRKERHRKLRN